MIDLNRENKRIEDLTGKKFGLLTVIGLDHFHYKPSGGRNLMWMCQCECGNTKIMRTDTLKSAACPNCGCMSSRLMRENSARNCNLIGGKFGRLTVINENPLRDKFGNRRWVCKCDCGNIINTPITSRLQNGMTKSCGCLRDDKIALQGKKNIGANNGMYGKRRELNPKWLGEDHRTEVDRLRKSGEYIEWRNQVYARDNFICQICGKVGGQLNAHHIKNFSQFEDLRFDIDNGVTLCSKCHRIVHTSMGLKTSYLDIDEFSLRNLELLCMPMPV